jgi:hypothetical protein
MKNVGTVTRQDISLETVGHPRMMQITSKFERPKPRFRRRKRKSYQREDASSDKGDAMITQTEDPVAWACTAVDKSMLTQSKWLWDKNMA